MQDSQLQLQAKIARYYRRYPCRNKYDLAMLVLERLIKLGREYTKLKEQLRDARNEGD